MTRPTRFGKALGALACLGVFSACTLMPHYERPISPAPASFPDYGGGAPVGSVDASAVSWQEFFVDERLRRLIALALENNRDLKIASLNIVKARAQYRIQEADLLPKLSANATQSVNRSPADLSATGRAATTRQYSANLGLSSYELDLFGRIRSLDAQALEKFLATEAARRSTQISLVAEVAQDYLTMAADRDQLELARRTWQSQNETLSLTRRQVELGMGSSLTLNQVETSVQSSRADIAHYARQTELDRNALTLLVGAAVPDSLLPEGLATALAPLMERGALPAGLPSALMERRPDLIEAEHELRAANADIGAARADFFPRISLTASAGTASADLGRLFSGGQGAWSFMPQISLPIFDGGSTRANLDIAKASKDVAVAQYEKAIQVAFREVADALAERSTLTEQVQAQRALVAAASASFDLSTVRYQKGIDSYLSVLDSQRALYAAQKALISEELAQIANVVSVYKVLGGGWSESAGDPA